MNDPAAQANTAILNFTGLLPDLVKKHAISAQFDWPTSGFVYQYTSVATLLAMLAPDRPYVDADPAAEPLGMQHLWATSAPFMNDSQEFDHGKEVMHAATRRIRRGKAGVELTLLDLIAQAIGETEGLDVFCACFTRAEDHLGQWRGYGDNGRGCVLGFDLQQLDMYVNGLPSWLIYGDITDPIQVMVSDRLVQDLLDVLKLYRPTSNLEQTEFDVAAKSELLRLLPSVFLLFKDGSFRDEFEYRIVYSDAVVTGSQPAIAGLGRRWFRASGPAIVPFIKLDFSNGMRAPLTSIRLGPASKFDLNVKSLRFMLDRCGLSNVIIEKSSIPFVPR